MCPLVSLHACLCVLVGVCDSCGSARGRASVVSLRACGSFCVCVSVVDLCVCVPLRLVFVSDSVCALVSASLSLLLTRANAHTRPVQFMVTFLATRCAAIRYSLERAWWHIACAREGGGIALWPKSSKMQRSELPAHSPLHFIERVPE